MNEVFELIKYSVLNRRCIFNVITGLYCPGCGGTRALSSLVHGHFILSLYYHPLVIYILIVLVVLVIRFVKLQIFEENKSKILLPNWVLYLMLAIVLGNFLIKNVLLLFFNIKMPLL